MSLANEMRANRVSAWLKNRETITPQSVLREQKWRSGETEGRGVYDGLFCQRVLITNVYKHSVNVSNQPQVNSE